MKAILLMLGALSAAIIFVGCGTAVGRATGVTGIQGNQIDLPTAPLPDKSGAASEKIAEIEKKIEDMTATIAKEMEALQKLDVPKHPQNTEVDEDRVRMIIQEEHQKYDSSEPKNEPASGPSMMQAGMMQEMKTQLDALQLPDQKGPAVDEEMVRALVSDEIKKSRQMFETMVVEEITNREFQVEELGLMLQELEAHLEAIRELEPILSDIQGLNSSVEGLQRSIIDAERVIGAIEKSNDDFQTSLQSQHDEVSRNIAHLSLRIQGLHLNENPVAATKVFACLADVDCLATLDTLTAHAENNFRDSAPFEVEALYSQLNSDGWNLDTLAENHKFAVLLYRQQANISYEIPCYSDPDCTAMINRLVELVYALEEHQENDEIRFALEEEVGQIDFFFFGYGHTWALENGLFQSPPISQGTKILFSPGHEDIIRRATGLIPGMGSLHQMVEN